MKEIIGANWLVLAPIILLSVGAVAIIIERAVYFRGIQWSRPDRLDHALELFGEQTASTISGLFEDGDRSPARVVLDYALKPGSRITTSLYKQRLEALRDRQIDAMERHLSLLPGIGNVATLMGLFGTVSGMITAFTRMTETGSSDPYVLAGGISRALVTTAAGLAVAIPAMFAHQILETLVDRHVDRMEDVVNECLYKAGASGARKRESETS